MSLATFLIFLSLIITPAALIYLILVQWPTLTQTKYHERLWIVRDQVMADVFAGQLEWSEGAENLVKHLESLAKFSDRVSLLNAILIRKVGVVPSEDVAHFEDIMLGPGTPIEDRNRLMGYLDQAQRATLRQLTYGSLEALIGASILGWSIVFKTAARPFKDRYVSQARPAARAEMLKVVQSH